MPIARLAEQRQKRNKYLQQKVQDTLTLPPPEYPAPLKTCQHGTYPLTVEEEKESARQYQEKLRMNRILQVRAQEMLFASQRVEEFRDRKTKDNKKLLNHLKEVWREDQRRRIASLEEEFLSACQSIGLSHDAALLVERNRAAKEKLLARQAEESRCWDTLRFEEAMQKEREQKEMREKVENAPTVRRKIVKSVSNIERSLARRYTHGPKPRPPERFGCRQSVYPPVSHSVDQDKMYTRLAGFPIDFKDTYLHSRYSVLGDRTNRPSTAVVNCPEEEEVDAWRAADAQRESNRCKRARQAELERLYNEQKLERGNAAAAKLFNDQRIALLEQEVEEALKEEERHRDRVHAAHLSCRRSSSAGHERRPLYTKHKISYPLSFPGPVIEGSPVQKETSPKKHTMAANVETRLKALEGHPVAIIGRPSEENKTEVGVDGKGIQNSESVIGPPQQGEFHQTESDKVDSESETKNVKICKPSDGEGTNVPQQGNSNGGAVIEPVVSKSSYTNASSSKTGEESPTRASCEHAQVKAAGNYEGNALKRPLVRSPYRHPMPNKVLEKVKEIPFRGQLNTSEKEVEDSGMAESAKCRSMGARAGPARRWKEKVKERVSDTSVLDSYEKGWPVKARYRMDVVQEDASGVAEELGPYHKEIFPKRAIHSRIHSSDVGEKQTSQSETKSMKPPFLSSGTQGTKKILTGTLSACSPRPMSESEGDKTTSAERASRIVKENHKSFASAERVSTLDTVKGSTKEDIYRSSVRGNFQLSPVKPVGGWSGGNKHILETSRSWAHPLRSQRRTHERATGEQRCREDSVLKWVERSLASPRRSWDINPRSKDRMCNDLSGGCVREVLDDRVRSREDVSKRGDFRNHQERRIEEPKPVRQKAVWKSYIGEPCDVKRTLNKDKLEPHPKPARSVRSEPPFSLVRNKRCSPGTRSSSSHQGDCPSEGRSEQGLKIPHVRKCPTPAASVRSLPTMRTLGSSCGKHKDGRMSRKDPYANRLGIQVEALEGISTRIRSLSKRFHSPVKLGPLETSPPRRSRQDGSPVDTYCLPTQSSTRKDHAKKLAEINIKSPARSCESVPLYVDADLAANKKRSRKDGGPRSARHIAERLINAWKNGKFEEDYMKAMKRAKEMSAKGTSSKINPERRYNKPWLSRSPSRRSPDQSRDDVNQDNGAQTVRSSSAALGIASKSLLTPSQTPSKSSQKSRNLTSKSSINLVRPTNKSPVIKSGGRSARKPATKDPWEAQSLDFVLGSLADQVRELDERLRSATASSPTCSSSPSLSRGSPLRAAMRTSNRPSFMTNLQDKAPKPKYFQDCSSLSSSTASSPDRFHQKSNYSSPTAKRNCPRAYTNERELDNRDFTFTAAERPEMGMYMDNLKTLLREMSNAIPSPPRRTVPSYCIKRRDMSEGKPHTDEAQRVVLKQPEALYAKNRGDAARAYVKTGFEPQYLSSTSISSSEALSQPSPLETRVVLVEKGRHPAVRESMESRLNEKGRPGYEVPHDGSHMHGDKKIKRRTERERTPQQVTHDGHEGLRERMEKRTFERSVPPEVAPGGHKKTRGDLEKIFHESRWAVQQAAQNRHDGVQERLEKRTVEIRGCAPHQVLHKGHAVVRNSSNVEQFEDSLASPGVAENCHDFVRSPERTSAERGRTSHGVADDNWAPLKQNIEARSVEWASAPHQVAPNGHVVVKESLERKTVQRGWAPLQTAGNDHVVVMESLERRRVSQVENRASHLAYSKEGQKFGNQQPESPLWGQNRSPLSPGDWRKRSLTLDEVEEKLLLSGSVDFSPWNTEKLPDIVTPQTAQEDGNCSKPSSPAVQEAGHANWVVPNNRPKSKLNEKQITVLQKLGRNFNTQQQRAQPVDFTFHPTPAPLQGGVPVNTKQVRTQVLERVKRPKSGPKGADALWAVSGLDASPELCRPQRGLSSGRTQKKMSIPRNARRPKKESSSSRDEMPDSASKSSQDDNYLPVVMAKDDESRREVIELRKKARQLDMEHRLRLSSRSSRPTSVRSCA